MQRKADYTDSYAPKYNRSVIIKRKTKREIFIKRKTKREIFINFYDRNRRLRYANGCLWKFANKTTQEEYQAFEKEYETITTFYKNSTVD